MPAFTRFETFDLRFSTSKTLYGSDAMNPDPDYSAAYVVVHTDDERTPEGHGFAFTIGRGNQVELEAIRALEPLVVERDVDAVLADMGAFWRSLCGESQLRWLGPDKGVMQMAVAAVVNAVWDLYAKRERKPLWKLLSDFAPAQIVDLLDLRYLSDALTREEAVAILERSVPEKAAREAELLRAGYPAYTTSAGWLGYTDERLREECRRAVAAGWRQFKLKVGGDAKRDVERCKIVREEIGDNGILMLDANQRWSADEAIARMSHFAEFKPRWIEEPTHPDDVLAHARIAKAIAPIAVAAGEHVPNAVVFKQLLQSRALGVCQVDACRSGGVNDVIATLLMAAKFDVPVCPHAGGVGLCELAQHLSMFDYVAVTGLQSGRAIEFVDQLHEHFADPVDVRGGRYMPPQRPGFSSEILRETLHGVARV
jgi:L-fuconate dehydratase